MSFNSDYRVNQKDNGEIISVEITCCGQKIGEIRYKDENIKVCPECGAKHTIRIHHNHFHLSREDQEQKEE